MLIIYTRPIHGAEPRFSHVDYASDYMRISVELVCAHFSGFAADNRKKVLDIPAGNGWIGDTLAEKGYEVVSADINQERIDFTQSNMEEALPFSDSSFDAVSCCEGIEHVFSPSFIPRVGQSVAAGRDTHCHYTKYTKFVQPRAISLYWISVPVRPF